MGQIAMTNKMKGGAPPPRKKRKKMKDNGRRCLDCLNMATMDFGYSNYTVEGTTCVCTLNVHPKPEFDRGWRQGIDEDNEYARKCEHFLPGGPGLTVDVDQEDVVAACPRLYEWFKDSGDLRSYAKVSVGNTDDPLATAPPPTSKHEGLIVRVKKVEPKVPYE